MARSRNIKPGFFTNEELVELDFATRLLFAGLWTQADREGRMQDRPKRLKMQLFPSDNVDVDAMLDSLARAALIVRYEVAGEKYICIPSWGKHQNPHHTEKASDIPAHNSVLTVKEALEPETAPVTAVLIPDSRFLIPDSLQEPTVLVDSAESPAANVVKLIDRRIPCPAEKLLEAFHAECPTLPRVMKLNDTRRKHLTARWREVDADSKFQSADDGIEVFRLIFRKVHANDFLAGRAKDWSATFDWLFGSSTNFLKVCEDTYDRAKK